MILGHFMAIVRNDAGRGIYQVGGNVVSETTLNAGNSPKTIAVASVLGYNGNRGYIANDDTADTILVTLYHDNATALTQFTIRAGEVLDLSGWDLSQIVLTRGTGDASYRVHVW